MDEMIYKRDAIDAASKACVEKKEYTKDDVRAAYDRGYAAGIEYQRNETLYGYSMSELVKFALACALYGITDADLKQFSTNFDFAYKAIQNSLKEVMRLDD